MLCWKSSDFPISVSNWPNEHFTVEHFAYAFTPEGITLALVLSFVFLRNTTGTACESADPTHHITGPEAGLTLW